MKFLHTSDWHLGRRLYGQDRQAEFVSFLDWLYQQIVEENIELLLVAGDIFDTTLPSNKAQKLYYKFLCKVATSPCKHVVITAGNHDSPSFLNAPKELLLALDIHVVSSKTDRLEDEIIFLNEGDERKAIICAVPYLRDRDVRNVLAGESADDKHKSLLVGIEEHYQQISKLALDLRGENNIPIIGMGHLFTTGGKTLDGDGVRDLYVGNLASVNAIGIAEGFDYLALGHLHIPQIVAKTEHIRYSGSPIPMGFGEARQDKQIIIGEFVDNDLGLESIKVPVFQILQSIKGSLEQIKTEIALAKDRDESIWLEIDYTEKTPEPRLREEIEKAVIDSKLEVRRIKNRASQYAVLKGNNKSENLSDISVEDVFDRCLTAHDLNDDKKLELQTAYKEIIRDLAEDIKE